MKFDDKNQLVDRRGRPFCERIQKALQAAVLRFRRQFPDIRDEAVLAGILEKTGERIVDREKRLGQVGRLPVRLGHAA